jgi:hypothetical protein
MKEKKKREHPSIQSSTKQRRIDQQRRLAYTVLEASVSDQDSLIPDPNPAYKAECQSGSRSRVLMTKLKKIYI